MNQIEREDDWSQVKGRVPKDLHRKAKIASAMLNKPIVDMIVEALEKAVKDAGVAA